MVKENAYMTVSVPGTKKVSVCGRRIGTRDRLNVIATANSEEVAERIVDALNALQGKLDKLDAPSRSGLEAVRQILTKERARSSEDSEKHRQERVELQRKLQDTEIKLHQVSRDLASMTARALKAENPLVAVPAEQRKCM